MFKALRVRKLKKQIDAALSDNVLTDDEVANVREKAEVLRLDGDKSNDILVEKVQATAKRKIQAIIDRVNETNRFSPGDEAEMREIAANLKLTFTMDLSPLANQRFLWAVENGEPAPLTPVRADIFLGRGEQCFHFAPASWRQIKAVRKNYGYVGSSMSFRVAKGVRFSVGRAIPISTTSDQMVTISDGTLYLTNQRLLFVGDSRSSETKFRSIANIEWYSDGCEVIKNRGKPDFYITDNLNAQLINAKLALIMSGQG